MADEQNPHLARFAPQFRIRKPTEPLTAGPRESLQKFLDRGGTIQKCGPEETSGSELYLEFLWEEE
jgi:hypothetical protein